MEAQIKVRPKVAFAAPDLNYSYGRGRRLFEVFSRGCKLFDQNPPISYSLVVSLNF